MRASALGDVGRESRTRPLPSLEADRSSPLVGNGSRCMYVVASTASFFSVGSMVYSISTSPPNVANVITSFSLALSYSMKLPYYRDKHLAAATNSLLSAGWFVTGLYAFVIQIS